MRSLTMVHSELDPERSRKITFSPPISKKNAFGTLSCHKMSVQGPEGGPNEQTSYRAGLQLVMTSLLTRIPRVLTSKLDPASFPPSHTSSRDVSIYVTQAIMDELGQAFFAHLARRCPWGVNVLTTYFCTDQTKRRIAAILEELAVRKNVPMSTYAKETGKGIRFYMNKLEPRELLWLIGSYQRVWKTPWLRRGRIQFCLNYREAFQTKDYPYNIILETEGKTPTGSPNFFMFTLSLKMNTDMPRSLKEDLIIRLAGKFFAQLEETKEDQTKRLTVQNLEIPATLVTSINHRYQQMVEKMKAVNQLVTQMKALKPHIDP